MQRQKNVHQNIQILVAAHKEYAMPTSTMYLPIHVGKEGKKPISFIGDNTGDNISLKNANYCELTALYWAWKNLGCEYIGLSHYRRYFSDDQRAVSNRKNKKKELFSFILTEEQAQTYLMDYDVILPRKRNYYIETVWNQYCHAHNLDDLVLTRSIVNEIYPDYIDSFDYVMNGRKLHLYNMFVMRKSIFDEYAEWLFTILFELEKHVDISGYSTYQARIFGFISERLFNVWIHHNQLKVKELGIIQLENENKIKKYTQFLKRKLYKSSGRS